MIPNQPRVYRVVPPFPRQPGSYLLQLSLAVPVMIDIGRLGTHNFPAGVYLYVGSAMGPGGLSARLGRHIKGGQRHHWHIDYLREVAQPVAAWTVASTGRIECAWAHAWRTLAPGQTGPVGFGASDCACSSHLVWLARPPDQALVLASAQQAQIAERPVYHASFLEQETPR